MKNTLLSLILVLALIFGFSPISSEAATLHAFLVLDTQAENIGDGVKVNEKNMLNAIQKIGDYTDLELNIVTFKGKEANSSFIDKIEKTEIDADDVVLFFWSGHGYRTLLKDWYKNPWPSFSFHNQWWAGMDLLDITKYLESKNPRLVIALAETCNSYTPIAPPMYSVASRAGYVNIRSNYQRLFLESSGTIIASSSKPGQYSWINRTKGGHFVNAFISSLNHEVSFAKDPKWESVMKKTKDNVKSLKLGTKQVPQYEVNVIYH
ncbi:MAG: hypothetical protein K940chlam3_00182 [Chlamydiae bacterium]|nr:hypothetical protein [Chlamydiota bacterium]